MRRYPGGGAFALFFHPHPREFATQNKKSANARGLARGGWAQLELTDALCRDYDVILLPLHYCYKAEDPASLPRSILCVTKIG